MCTRFLGLSLKVMFPGPDNMFPTHNGSVVFTVRRGWWFLENLEAEYK